MTLSTNPTVQEIFDESNKHEDQIQQLYRMRANDHEAIHQLQMGLNRLEGILDGSAQEGLPAPTSADDLSTQDKAKAWSAVWDHCISLGMQLTDTGLGLESVTKFIDYLNTCAGGTPVASAQPSTPTQPTLQLIVNTNSGLRLDAYQGWPGGWWDKPDARIYIKAVSIEHSFGDPSKVYFILHYTDGKSQGVSIKDDQSYVIKRLPTDSQVP